MSGYKPIDYPDAYYGTYDYEPQMLFAYTYADRLVFRLPHQCNDWEIGGVEQARQLRDDLTAALAALDNA